MTLVHTSKAEFSEMFTQFFENCAPEIEAIPNAPFDRIDKEPAITLSDAPGATKHLNLDPAAFPDVCNAIVGDFFGHCRNKDDYSIQSLRLLRNPVTWHRYQGEKQVRRRLAEDVDMFRDEILFHGTPKRKLPSILQNNLDPRTTVRANYGKGVYFSDSIEKCMQYVDTQTSMEQEYSIILCCVLLGKVWVEPYEKAQRKLDSNTMFLPEGYDSAVGHDSFKEWIVYEKSQVLPLCVINFKASNNADCYHRLSSHGVLFQGLNFYPTSMHLIQTICNVPTPTDNNAPSSGADKDDYAWKTPAPQEASMLWTVLNIPIGEAQIKKIKFPKHEEFVVTAKNRDDRTVYFYINHSQWTLLIGVAKNIQVLEERNKLDTDKTFMERSRQRLQIEELVNSVPECEALIVKYTEIKPELDAIEAEGVKLNQTIESLKAQAFLSGAGRPDIYNTHEFQLAVHPYQNQLNELKQMYDAKVATLGPLWNAEHVGKAIQVRAWRHQLQTDVAADHVKEQRRLSAIEVEKSKAYSQAIMCSTIVTLPELEARIQQAKNERENPNPAFGHTEDFAFKTTQVLTHSSQIWAQVVAELLMPTLMISQMPSHRMRLLNETNVDDVGMKLQMLQLKSISKWYEIAPRAFFDMPMASTAFWPIHPQNKLPNRRLFMMKDFVEWIFLEKERRIRATAQSRSRPGMMSRLVRDSLKVDEDPLFGVDVHELYKEQWEQLDPCILKALKGLKSRSGTVVFNRQERQEELDKLGKDLIGSLFVLAEPDMLILDESSHKATSVSVSSAITTASSSLSSSFTATASTPSPSSECPICQDPLVISEPGKTVLVADQVVKLKSCRHCFHQGCIVEWFKAKDSQLKCPMCNVLCTARGLTDATKDAFKGSVAKLGPMPDGYMAYTFDDRLACYFLYINIPCCQATSTDGTTETIVTVPPDRRYAVVPVTAKLGPLLIIRLICLFYYGHMFRIGESVTRGIANVVVWNGVHLRTAMTGAYGFPAPEFELSCWQEINQKGVAMGLDELLLSIPHTKAESGSPLVEEPEIVLPEGLAAEMSAQNMIHKILHPERTPLFQL
ncbi:hypothetical protein BG000_007159 [Podila horticola]|nr:hypothetical protein BG000_007159 [Podila horticola]